jgi:hypothetical protein
MANMFLVGLDLLHVYPCSNVAIACCRQNRSDLGDDIFSLGRIVLLFIITGERFFVRRINSGKRQFVIFFEPVSYRFTPSMESLERYVLVVNLFGHVAWGVCPTR